MSLVVSVAVVIIMGAVIVLAAEDSSHSLAGGWRVRGESPVRYEINYSSQWLVLGCCYGARSRTLTSRSLPLED